MPVLTVASRHLGLAGARKEISEEEGNKPLIPSSTMVGWLKAVCVMKLTRAIVSSSSRMSLTEAVWTSSPECP